MITQWRILVMLSAFSLIAASEYRTPDTTTPVIHRKGTQLVANIGIWLGRGNTTGPLMLPVPTPQNWYGYGIKVQGDLMPSPELLQLEKARFLRKPLQRSDRLIFDPKTKEVRYTAGDRVLRHSLNRPGVFLAETMADGFTYSFATPGPQSRDVLMVPVRGEGWTTGPPSLIVVFQVARDEPEQWLRTIIPLSGLIIDLERVHDEAYGVYREGSQYALFLPGNNRTPIPGFSPEDRAWELNLPESLDEHFVVNLFPLPLQRQ
ncbi:MAG: hypothetical protein AAF560_17950 [Acidobacteriota bacterium]